MGANLSYIAIKSKSPSEICQELSLRRTGQWSDGWGSGITAGKSPTDWYVIVDRYDEIVRDSNKTQVLGKLSRGSEVLHCEISEGCMISSAELWSDGTKV